MNVVCKRQGGKWGILWQELGINLFFWLVWSKSPAQVKILPSEDVQSTLMCPS